ncbi:MAG: S-layer homology domain-containing protein [Anaerovoracaceae bacterium]
MKKNSNLLILALIAVLIFGSMPVAADKGKYDLDDVLKDTADFLISGIDNPEMDTAGGEWTVIGLARYGEAVSQSYLDKYYKNLLNYVIKNNGILHARKYTEYSRVVLALTAIGKEPENVGGYDLLAPLGDYDKVTGQGINGPIFALLALDSGVYDMPQVPLGVKQGTRDMYVDAILSAQLGNGGFALAGSEADPDLTGMALQALAKYRGRNEVETAVKKALDCLSKMQDEDAGFKDSEGIAQVLTALCELGISYEDDRFVKNGKNLMEALLSYYKKGEGFSHLSSDDKGNGMATEQAFYGMVSVKRALEGRSSLYRMIDVERSTDKDEETIFGDRQRDVKPCPIIFEGKTFSDIENHRSQNAVGALAERGIINGTSDNYFNPDGTMKRSEFAAISVRALGLLPNQGKVFNDVLKNSWYESYVGTAYLYGIVKGVGDNRFNPDGTITREEAAVMVTRAADLCGIQVAMGEEEVRNTLASFTDYMNISKWAMEAVAFSYREKIFSHEGFNIDPGRSITRSEVAEMFYRMLSAARLM